MPRKKIDQAKALLGPYADSPIPPAVIGDKEVQDRIAKWFQADSAFVEVVPPAD